MKDYYSVWIWEDEKLQDPTYHFVHHIQMTKVYFVDRAAY